MADRAQSYQQLDPVGGYSIRPITLVMSVGILVFSIIATAWDWAAATMPEFAVGAVLACAAAVGSVTYWSNPLRAPFPRLASLVAAAAGTASMVFSALSTWGGPVIQGWGPVVLGLIILQLGSYRPPRELLLITLSSAAVAAFLAAVRPGTIEYGKPHLVVIVEAAFPLLSLGLASQAYASFLARSLGQASPAMEFPETVANAQLRDEIARSVQQDRVTILDRSVIPFLTAVLERNEIRAEDQQDAAAIADAIRTLMIADVDRSWLDSVIEGIGPRLDGVPLLGSEVIQDDDRAAGSMTPKHRTVVRALLVALFAHPGFDPDGFGILLERRGSLSAFMLTAKLDGEESLLRSGLGVYFAVLRLVFTDLQVTFDSPTVTLRFSYDHK
jgi:hypothetical protein